MCISLESKSRFIICWQRWKKKRLLRLGRRDCVVMSNVSAVSTNSWIFYRFAFWCVMVKFVIVWRKVIYCNNAFKFLFLSRAIKQHFWKICVTDPIANKPNQPQYVTGTWFGRQNCIWRSLICRVFRLLKAFMVRNYFVQKHASQKSVLPFSRGYKTLKGSRIAASPSLLSLHFSRRQKRSIKYN